MKYYDITFQSAFEDVCNWTENIEELKQWTKEKLEEELTESLFETLETDEPEQGVTYEEIIWIYYRAIQTLIEELENQ